MSSTSIGKRALAHLGLAPSDQVSSNGRPSVLITIGSIVQIVGLAVALLLDSSWGWLVCGIGLCLVAAGYWFDGRRRRRGTTTTGTTTRL